MERIMHATRTTHSNPLRELEACGQSVWLDFIQRSLMSGGTLDRLIEEDGLRGITSNPSIFEKAIADGNEYAGVLAALRDHPDTDAVSVYEHLAITDVCTAADRFLPVYRGTHQRDGYVSLEVSPRLATDTKATIREARRLWRQVDRPNLMIKVPATAEGLPAIETLLAEGINVNVTLLFSIDVYRPVTEAYLRALETRAAAGADLSCIASVASFFVSRVDTAVDGIIARHLAAESTPGLEALLGKTAIANAKIAYRQYQATFSGTRWENLAQAGARTQRLLWASTSTKNPDYRDVLYVEELIGSDTVNTLPPATLDAFREHGRVRPSLTESVDEAARIIATLPRYGIDLETVTDRLLDDGVAAFAHAYEQLLATLHDRLSAGQGAT
jgi:transaldolase/glucose-6-phosphate isomerase